jgi:hypothetical protein
MKKKKKKSELIGLTRQIWDSCHESLILNRKKKLRVNPELTGLTRQTWNPCHESLISKYKKFNINKLH